MISIPYDSDNLFHKYTKTILDTLLDADVPISFGVGESENTYVNGLSITDTPNLLVIEDERLRFIFELKGGNAIWERIKGEYRRQTLISFLREYLGKEQP